MSHRNVTRIQNWPHADAPTEAQLVDLLAAEGLQPYRWGNASHDVYAAHRHTYDKVIYVVRGSITFGLPDTHERIELHAGDRLDLSAGVLHDAIVGAKGVTCLEAHC